jgi:NitT/TauT family transport system substrate-binding protein
VITSRAYAAQHAELVAAFTRAVGAGWATYLASPDATNAVMQKLNTSMDAETFRAAAAAQKPLIEGDDAATKGVGAMTQERWDTFAKQLTALGVLKQAPVIDFLVSGK